MELGSTKARLYIDCARESDAGLYTCVAETTTKRITTSTLLYVGEFDNHSIPFRVTALDNVKNIFWRILFPHWQTHALLE